MAKQGVVSTEPGEEMEAAGEVELSAGPPEIFGDQIEAGDTVQRKPGAEDVGDLGPESLQGGVEGPGGPEEPVGFLNTKWPDDVKLPEGLEKYETPGALLEAHTNLVKKIGERSDELQQLRTDNKALRDGKVSEESIALANRAQDEIGEGGLKRDTIDAFAQATRLPPPVIAALSQMMVERSNQFLESAAKALGGEDKVQKFLEAMQDGRFTQGELDTYNGWATLGRVAWIGEVAPQLGFEVDEAALKPAAAAEHVHESKDPSEPSPGVNRAIQQVTVGEAPGPPPGPDVFKTRAEYLTASSIAEQDFQETGDSSKKDAVSVKLHRSNTQAWGTQVGG